jgi:hypothetical protein
MAFSEEFVIKAATAMPSDLDNKTIALIESIAGQIRTSIADGKLPDIKLPAS